MGLPEQRVPEVIGSVDIRTLPLTALDGFVFSRIDGRATTGDIVAMTGLGAEQVHESLSKLELLGAIRFHEPHPRLPSLTVPSSSQPPRAPQPRPSLSTPSSSQPPRLSQPPRASGAPPPSMSSTPPRRRPSYGHSPRKLLSESSITSPPADMRTIPPRAPVGPSARPRTPVPAAGRARERPSSDYRSVPPLDGTPSSPPAPLRPSQVELDRSLSQLTESSMSFDTPTPVSASLYDPRELEEPVALPLERRKQILELYYRYKELDYYAVLGVSNRATKAEIRTAYFTLSKAFHPDSMFRKELGSYKAKMTTVFQALTEAYDTLSKKKSREEYDAYQRSTRSTQDAERALATEPIVETAISMEVPRPPALPSTDYQLPEPTPMPPPREASPESRRLARELIARRLRGLAPRALAPSQGIAAPESDAAPAQASSPAAVDRQAIARTLTRALIDVGRVSGSADKVGRCIAEARAAVERGEIAAAVQSMAQAVALAPERADLQTEYDNLSRVLAIKLADEYAEQASFEQKHGKWAAAAISWAKVCEGRPDDSQAQRATALALLKAGGDLRSAQQYAQRAVFLEPDDVDARVLLAQAYLTVGLKLNARRELDAAAKLDPENEMVKNLLSELKG